MRRLLTKRGLLFEILTQTPEELERDGKHFVSSLAKQLHRGRENCVLIDGCTNSPLCQLYQPSVTRRTQLGRRSVFLHCAQLWGLSSCIEKKLVQLGQHVILKNGTVSNIALPIGNRSHDPYQSVRERTVLHEELLCPDVVIVLANERILSLRSWNVKRGGGRRGGAFMASKLWPPQTRWYYAPFSSPILFSPSGKKITSSFSPTRRPLTRYGGRKKR